EAAENDQPYDIENFGLQTMLSGPEDRMRGEPDQTLGTTVKLHDTTNWMQVETCARCHARRNLVAKHYEHSEEMLDNILPQVLRENIYHADGQIQDEVYVYASFAQSTMYHAGVRCTDCHDAHSLKLIPPDNTPSNLLCIRCHKPDRYDTPEHHHHPTTAFNAEESGWEIPGFAMGIPAPPGPPGTNCVDCHLPTQTYMQVDPRRDHSMRVPRPDLSEAVHAPNACTMCHADKDNAWATAATEEWYGSKKNAPKHFGQIIDQARHGNAEILPELIALVQNEEEPIIVRATGLTLLERFPTQETVNALAAAVKHEDSLMRYSAIGGFMMLPPEQRFSYVVDLLNDPVDAVRAEAARVMTDVPDNMYNMIQRGAYRRAVETFKEIQSVNIDRPEANLNMALYYAVSEQPVEAEKYFRRAVEMNPLVHQARFHLAQYLRQLGRDKEAEPLLRTVLSHHEDYGDAHYDLGLLLATSGRLEEGLRHLQRAAQLMPTFPRVYYNYALALNQANQPEQAIVVMKMAWQKAPQDRDILLALVTLHRDHGKLPEAFAYAQQLVQLTQGDPGAVQLMQQVQQMMINR
ncbi:MAG: tetratricopeptide repeat protein, partial [Planctomycetota bacterium]